MKASTKRNLATTWLVIAGFLGVVGFLQLAAVFDGSYDPVRHDNVPVDTVPVGILRLAGITAFLLITGLLAFRYVKNTKT